MGADAGELVQVMRRALDGSLTFAGTLQFFQIPGAVAVHADARDVLLR